MHIQPSYPTHTPPIPFSAAPPAIQAAHQTHRFPFQLSTILGVLSQEDLDALLDGTSAGGSPCARRAGTSVSDSEKFFLFAFF
ncbi:hypothetical protein HBI56_158380 [Parastagonospora nodorum]|uniref:Uncharacterized protein n=1 Tax=Phaeosphaeria nodorum (strain SN15 / ATCC MYA-4574 / FGSC 10173) TaxID=321614 RepID=A0A7U2ET47_PHANO|nr:hypothetical protein HBH56_189100 [Parastagonospora nodorum]QRC92301.1 hypothetical protein JI435_402210 [Parastagonospora nodorum SN15]KAH3925081.1 hypothetical protein HBH54_184910 [Parastagonospora nodorum]KAH3954396.1 hypothetical protein HBH53_024260 [Parastagonospora nodorum]KAH3963820.1 hypothetical protein HBH51_164100 [Parastagonospora nodorum]